MRYFLTLLLVSVLLYGFVPLWWVFVPATALAGYWLASSPLQGFAIGLGTHLLFVGISVALLNESNDGILAYRIAGVLGLPSAFSMIAVTAVLHGLLGGLAGWGGALLQNKKRAVA